MRFLYVEDDDDTVEMLQDWMGIYGVAHSFYWAKTGKEALEALKHGGFDGVILDLILPDMSGSMMIAKARSLGYSVPPIVVASGNCMASRDLHSKRVEAIAIVLKPYDPQIILSYFNEMRASI